jgi:hypothetical protein
MSTTLMKTAHIFEQLLSKIADFVEVYKTRVSETERGF